MSYLLHTLSPIRQRKASGVHWEGGRVLHGAPRPCEEEHPPLVSVSLIAEPGCVLMAKAEARDAVASPGGGVFVTPVWLAEWWSGHVLGVGGRAQTPRAPGSPAAGRVNGGANGDMLML